MKVYRTLKLSAFWKWGWQKRTSISMVGFSLFFAGLSWPMVGMLPSEEKIDVESIMQRGSSHVGEVIAVGTNSRITVNGANPAIIAFRYELNGNEVEGRHQTMDFVSVQTTEIGDGVEIKSLNGQSIIGGLSVYQFPYALFNLFYVIPILMGGIPAVYLFYFLSKKSNLHKHGLETQAVIESIEPIFYIRRIGFRSRSKDHHRIYFSFIDSNGEAHSAADDSTDKLIARDAKKGDLIDIVYLEEKPTTACLFERFLVK